MGWIIGIVVAVALFIVIILLKTNKKDEHDQYGQKTTLFMPLNEKRGIQGEREVNYTLLKLLKEDEYLLTNILIPLRNGRTTEIDTLLITRKGIFCIETKNWVGHIIGDDESEYWIQKYNNPYKPKNQQRNPVIQNERHCSVLERELGNCYDVYNIVIFPKIEDRTYLYSRHTYDLSEFIKYYGTRNDILYPEDIEEVAQALKCYETTEEQMRAHRERVKREHQNER